MRFACLFTVCALVAMVQFGATVEARDQRARSCLDIHNRYRQMHGVPSLQWDENLANFAQSRSNYMASNNVFRHEANTPHGENLAQFSDLGADCAAMVKMWYDEIRQYNQGSPGFSSGTGHFTQLVWRDSKRLGCGMANGPSGVVLTCNYSPAGNVQGRFEANVPARTRGGGGGGGGASEPAVSSGEDSGSGSGSITIEHSGGHGSASSLMERMRKQMEEQMRAHRQFMRDSMPSFGSSSSSSSSWRSSSESSSE